MSPTEDRYRQIKTLHRAEIVIGIDGVQPVRDAGVIVDEEGRIIAIGSASTLDLPYDHVEEHQILMPGVINCHVHLTDANIREPVPGGSGLVAWVRNLLAARGSGVADTAEITATIDSMQRLGTVAIGEVVNDRSTLEGVRASGIRCRYIHELLAFPAARAADVIGTALEDLHDEERIAVALGLHAPYSVSPELHALAAGWGRQQGRNVFEHLAEDPDERALYRDGSGPWRALLEKIGAWDPAWNPPGCSPIEYLDRLGIFDERYIAVHLADATPAEISILAGRGARAILSPRSNLHITSLFPPVAQIVESGMRFALGTDGRGSSPTVDVFDEAATILENGPLLPPGRLLEALTMDGAAILQMPDLGALSPGNAPGLVSVEIKETSGDLRILEWQIILDATRRRIC